jgi:hypothetical protein
VVVSPPAARHTSVKRTNPTTAMEVCLNKPLCSAGCLHVALQLQYSGSSEPRQNMNGKKKNKIQEGGRNNKKFSQIIKMGK